MSEAKLTKNVNTSHSTDSRTVGDGYRVESSGRLRSWQQINNRSKSHLALNSLRHVARRRPTGDQLKGSTLMRSLTDGVRVVTNGTRHPPTSKGLSALPAPLHSYALSLVGLDCTSEHVKLVSEHSSRCLGNDTLRKHLHENAIKSFFL
ncbi:hypothetical protein EYF80_002934 [Liparis tanakae]|uniref:Uncharacterized protein n=1 Tax=Liparis tanakae TaxID=230148 RepID=A0A4Z2JA00_9TELE|nr:hypothetical protein EYF80_002934 [Liparis tanakae]